MNFCVSLPGIVENSVSFHGKVMGFYYEIFAGTLIRPVSGANFVAGSGYDPHRVQGQQAAGSEGVRPHH